MPPEELSDKDKIFKAQALKQRMELEADLKTFAESLDEVFKIGPPMKLVPAEKEELERLRVAIRGAAASNQARGRILELLGKALRV